MCCARRSSEIRFPDSSPNRGREFGGVLCGNSCGWGTRRICGITRSRERHRSGSFWCNRRRQVVENVAVRV